MVRFQFLLKKYTLAPPSAAPSGRRRARRRGYFLNSLNTYHYFQHIVNICQSMFSKLPPIQVFQGAQGPGPWPNRYSLQGPPKGPRALGPGPTGTPPKDRPRGPGPNRYSLQGPPKGPKGPTGPQGETQGETESTARQCQRNGFQFVPMVLEAHGGG